MRYNVNHVKNASNLKTSYSPTANR